MGRARPKPIHSLVASALGPLETDVLRQVCRSGRCRVRDVVKRLDNRFAYTTVMTTMDRLFQKGLLRREPAGKAYVYSTALSETQVDAQYAHDLIAAFLLARQAPSSMLARELVNAIDNYNAILLDEVEKEIRIRRNAALLSEASAERFATSAALVDMLPLGNA